MELIEREKVGCEEMEGSLGDGGGGAVGKNGERSDGRPPNPFAGAYRQSYGVALGGSPGGATLIRHGSLVRLIPSLLFSILGRYILALMMSCPSRFSFRSCYLMLFYVDSIRSFNKQFRSVFLRFLCLPFLVLD